MNLQRKHSDFAFRLINFIKTFFPNEENNTPELHFDILDLISQCHRKNLVVSFRGSAKTTIVGKYLPLYNSFNGDLDPVLKELSYMLFITDTVSQAEDNVKELKDAYELACENYPEFKKLVRVGSRYLVNEVEFINARGYVTNFLALGSGQKVRGVKRRGKRPMLLLVDDLENDECVNSQKSRSDLKRWFFSALLPALHPTKSRIFFIGTPLHQDSLLENLRKDRTWSKIEIPIIDDEGHSVWQDRFPLGEIDNIKQSYKEQGLITSFYQEYLLKIISTEDAVFKSEYFRYASFSNLPKDLYFYITVDLAISTSNNADKTAFIVNGVDSANNWHIVKTRALRINPSEQIKNLFELAKWCYDFNKKIPKIAVEMVSYQKSFKDIYEKELNSRPDLQRILPVLTELKPDGKKERRISSLEPLFVRRKIIFYRGGSIEDLENELLSFPKSKHDDLSDALAYQLQIVKLRSGEKMSVKKSTHKTIYSISW